MTRPRRRLLALGLLLAAGAAGAVAFLLVNFPFASRSAYLEARRWARAATIVERLPKELPPHPTGPPCRPMAQSKAVPRPGQFFPPGVFGCDEHWAEVVTESYSDQLRALREPSLWALSQTDSRAMVYRFLWLRSFHPPISVRVVIRPDRTGEMVSKVGSPLAGSTYGPVKEKATRPLDRHSAALLFTLVNYSLVWNLPSAGGPSGLDGAEWILERVDNGCYHLVERFSPAAGDPVRTLGLLLVNDIAHLNVPLKSTY